MKREPTKPRGFIKPNGVGIPRLQAEEEVNLILSGMVGALVLVVFIMGGHEHVWWAGLIALAGWLLLFVPRFVREDRRWRKENK